MYRAAPRLEERTAEEIADLVRSLLERSKWSRPDPPAEALIRIFGRYWEIAVDRLNRAPDKHFLAFLDLLGVTPIAARPARVPLTFVPAESSPAVVYVPIRTQVAADAADAMEPKVVFETERPLELTTATLDQAFVLDPLEGTETELKDLVDAILPESVIWNSSKPCDHILFIGHSTQFGLASITRQHLRFEISAPSSSPDAAPSIEWVMADNGAGLLVIPSSDGTQGLTRSGDVIFDAFAAPPELELFGRKSRWLECRLTSRLPHVERSVSQIRKLEIISEISRIAVPMEAAYCGSAPMDLTKDFFPFGERPVFGVTLFISSLEVFTHRGAAVKLEIQLTNPYKEAKAGQLESTEEDQPLKPVYSEGHPRVSWEYWNGAAWTKLVATDGTKAFRIDGTVSFVIPDDLSQTTVNGIEGCWIRARLTSGNYGEEHRWEPVDPNRPESGLRHIPATLSPPSIKSLTASFKVKITAPAPEFALTLNERVHEDISEQLKTGEVATLFGHPCGTKPALYLGIEPSRSSPFVNSSFSLYQHVAAQGGRIFSRSGEANRRSFEWQYWNGFGWRYLDVSDESESFSISGIVSFLVPHDATPRKDLAGNSLYWLRIVGLGTDTPHWNRLRGILRNTTLATSTLTLEKEVLGSSNGGPLQHFYATRSPMLERIELQVRETDAASELDQIVRETSMAAVETKQDATSGRLEVWVNWAEVSDFLESDDSDRHYVVERQTGEIRFGDGRHGRIPPRGSNNIRLRRYQTGGGLRGNVAKDKASQLMSAIPYVESVTNSVGAFGGSDPEEIDFAVERGASTVRHRNRAVTTEDYEDLARLASAEVARAWSIPLRDLALDPNSDLGRRPGVVSLIIVPKTEDTKPLPSASLLRTVREYLDRRRNASTELVVVGPEYVQVSVEIELVLKTAQEAGRIAVEVRERLTSFLHPLSGGSLGQGWRLGEMPHRSELVGLCAAVRGVDHINSLGIRVSEERSGLIASGEYVVYSGEHQIRLR